MYKKVYIEITNNCNLSCDFCPHNKRKNEFITLDNFNLILDKLENYTKYLYLHVLGEPLLYPNVNEIIDVASKRYKINITTNGYLIDKIKNNKNIRQINISLHSYSGNIPLEKYISNILASIDILSKYTYISLRFWTENKYSKDILKYINKYFNVNIEELKKCKIKENIFLDIDEEFIWPDVNNNIYNEGTCYALRDHIGILVDGSIVPCCLDSNGIITLGNIYKDNISDVINSKRYTDMLNGFKNNKKCEELCKHCNFNKIKK
ncbi:MAG: SPASM domain-containing protein [Bacillales bacterium]|nr:SPASM domain-containing protein [Bacillales bacterium]